MLKSSTSICFRCRYSLLSEWLLTAHHVSRRRFQTSSIVLRSALEEKPNPHRSLKHIGSFPKGNRFENKTKARILPRPVDGVKQIPPAHLTRMRLGTGLLGWVRLPRTKNRLRAMGVEEKYIDKLLRTFLEEIPRREGGYFPPEEDEYWQMDRIREEMSDSVPTAVDHALSRRFMAWAISTLPSRGNFPPEVVQQLVAVQEALDYRHPGEWFPRARMSRRKIHMHVGPTNSGKTHHALRALAASKFGVYASPLRLLAFEVFERLNKGMIVPAGGDPNDPPEKHARPCNMVTGEEMRVVDPSAKLLSCTVEMLSNDQLYDVAVIDEIQMLTDSERGGAWTTAVLGVSAAEVHLCGEEAAVPLVQSLLEETHDEVIVHRYDRLTPLVVAKKSLKGKLEDIQKGDCVVTFSRTGIFGLKRRIEELTGMRCAVVYGRLPPEVRAEQAALFNDPESGYDVLIGSDAIGMGLNLKIRRIVFEHVHKWDGEKEIQLSLSQLKQIAGRAGRFGMHDEDESGGIVTSLYEADLPVVRKAVELCTMPPAKRAIIPTRSEQHRALEQLLVPELATFATIFDLQSSIALLRPCYKIRSSHAARMAADVIDELCHDHTLEERITIFTAPVQWRDEPVQQAMLGFLRTYRSGELVDLQRSVRDMGLLNHLEGVQRMKQIGAKKSSSMISLVKLESLYRIIVIYMWMGMRFPTLFHQKVEATDLKKETESAIDWCLAGLKGHGGGRGSRREEHAAAPMPSSNTVDSWIHSRSLAPLDAERGQQDVAL